VCERRDYFCPLVKRCFHGFTRCEAGSSQYIRFDELRSRANVSQNFLEREYLLTHVCSSKEHTPVEQQADSLPAVVLILTQEGSNIDYWQKEMNMVKVTTD